MYTAAEYTLFSDSAEYALFQAWFLAQMHLRLQNRDDAGSAHAIKVSLCFSMVLASGRWMIVQIRMYTAKKRMCTAGLAEYALLLAAEYALLGSTG